MGPPKWLVLGPGAMAFYAILGQLSQVDTHAVQAVSGSSAGAILAFFLVREKDFVASGSAVAGH